MLMTLMRNISDGRGAKDGIGYNVEVNVGGHICVNNDVGICVDTGDEICRQ